MSKQSEPGKGGNSGSRTVAPSRPAEGGRATGFGNWRVWLERWLALPVSGASLAVFRICVGVVMALEAWDLCRPNLAAITAGTTPLETYYAGSDITFHFPFAALSWLPLLPPAGIYLVVGLLAVGGVMMALGLFYRLAAVTVFLSWGYLWVVESTRTYWQSHYYLEFLLAFLLIWMPAARRYSLDAWRKRGSESRRTIPFWPMALLRGQLVIAYFYAGVAKFSSDWILDAMPVRWFLAEPGVTAPYAPYLPSGVLESFKAFTLSPALAYFFSWVGLVFDLAVGFLLLGRRTRILGLVLMLIFHATNHLLIFDDIGWFPIIGALTALIFLDPDWPERFWGWVKRPRWSPPDWKWLKIGAVAVPVVGAALGWKLKASAPPAEPPHRLSRWAFWFVVVWLGTQALIPLRHYAIPGDGRFTYEGMSFSWRLKAEVRNAHVHRLTLVDRRILAPEDSGRWRIHWNEWKGDRTLYRELAPGRVNWAELPEVVVVLEPLIGERVLFNPQASNVQSEAAMVERIRGVWRELHGGEPEILAATQPFPEVLQTVAEEAKRTGDREEGGRLAELAGRAEQLEAGELAGEARRATLAEIAAALRDMKEREDWVPLLRRLHPFALEGEGHPPVPFYLIEDPALRQSTYFLDKGKWRNGPATRGARRPLHIHAGGEPLVVHMGVLGAEGKKFLPAAYLADSQARLAAPPAIVWNSARDLPISKLIHTSNQAFYLRRYARRVAELWEAEYGRRPAVHATTAVSLNGRPHQRLVDPSVDLASVPVKWFGRNEWVLDLETKRIPREALERGAPTQ